MAIIFVIVLVFIFIGYYYLARSKNGPSSEINTSTQSNDQNQGQENQETANLSNEDQIKQATNEVQNTFSAVEEDIKSIDNFIEDGDVAPSL